MRSMPTAALEAEFVILARSCMGLNIFPRYSRKTTREPAVIWLARTRLAPYQRTSAVPIAATTSITGESSALIFRACSAASTDSRLRLASFSSSRSPCAKAWITRIAPSDSSTVETISLCFSRTCLVDFLTRCVKRWTKRKRNGVTAIAISVNFQSRYSMTASMPTIVVTSITIESSEVEKNPWTLSMSSVMVERMFPSLWWS